MRQLRKKDDVVNYSVFAAGTFSNILLAFVALFMLSAVFVPVGSAFFSPDGVVLRGVEPGSPAAAAGLRQGMPVMAVDGQPVDSLKDNALLGLQFLAPNKTVVFSDGASEFIVVAAQGGDGRGRLGIVMEQAWKNQGTAGFAVFSWVQQLLALVATLSFGIGLANMIPVGPLDGGKMLHLAMTKLRGEKKANRAFVKFSILLLIVILFLLSPIFKAIIKSVAGIF